MKRATTFFVLLVATAAFAAPAAAGLRIPQIDFDQTSLQTRLTGIPQAIDVEQHQNSAIAWGATASDTRALVLKFEIPAGIGASDGEIGIVKMDDETTMSASPYVPVFPKGAAADWYAVATFWTVGGVDKLIVNVFDDGANLQTSTAYDGVDRNLFSYYIKQGENTYHSVDGFNGDGKVHALAYQGTGVHSTSWWLSWESSTIDGAYTDEDFDDALVLMEALNVTPVTKSTWAAVKDRFR